MSSIMYMSCVLHVHVRMSWIGSKILPVSLVPVTCTRSISSIVEKIISLTVFCKLSKFIVIEINPTISTPHTA